jgi:hypothetical protein
VGFISGHLGLAVLLCNWHYINHGQLWLKVLASNFLNLGQGTPTRVLELPNKVVVVDVSAILDGLVKDPREDGSDDL